MRKQMPKVGKEVITDDGEGVILENNVITERSKVKVMLPDGSYDIKDYPFRELKLKHPQQNKHHEKEEKPEEKPETESLDE